MSKLGTWISIDFVQIVTPLLFRLFFAKLINPIFSYNLKDNMFVTPSLHNSTTVESI